MPRLLLCCYGIPRGCLGLAMVCVMVVNVLHHSCYDTSDSCRVVTMVIRVVAWVLVWYVLWLLGGYYGVPGGCLGLGVVRLMVQRCCGILSGCYVVSRVVAIILQLVAKVLLVY